MKCKGEECKVEWRNGRRNVQVVDDKDEDINKDYSGDIYKRQRRGDTTCRK